MLDAVMQAWLMSRMELVALEVLCRRVGSTQKPSPVEAHHVVAARKGMISKGRITASSSSRLNLSLTNNFGSLQNKNVTWCAVKNPYRAFQQLLHDYKYMSI